MRVEQNSKHGKGIYRTKLFGKKGKLHLQVLLYTINVRIIWHVSIENNWQAQLHNMLTKSLTHFE